MVAVWPGHVFWASFNSVMERKERLSELQAALPVHIARAALGEHRGHVGLIGLAAFSKCLTANSYRFARRCSFALSRYRMDLSSYRFW